MADFVEAGPAYFFVGLAPGGKPRFGRRTIELTFACYKAVMRLAGKSIVITGATGIAEAGAERMTDEGAAVFVIARRKAQCEPLANRLGAGWALADLTDESATKAAFDAAVKRLGRVDGLFAVAGGSGRRFGDGPAHEVPLEGWDKTIEINTSPAFLATRSALRAMREQNPSERGIRGSIVLVSSVLAEHPVPSLFATHAYAASKGATNAFALAVAAYYASEGIRVNALAAGLVRTPMSERAASDAVSVAYSEKKQPLARGFLDPSDIADAAVFLLSDEASRITGQVIDVDGGWGLTEAGP